MASQTVFAGKSQKLYTNAYTRDDYYFLGWNTQKDGEGTFFKDNETYTFDGKEPEMNLYAQWKKGEGTYSICFVDLMNGYESKTIEVNFGVEYSLPDIKEIFVRDNKFIEWNTTSDGSGDSYANQTVVKDLVQAGGTFYLYARWAIKLSFDANNGIVDPNTPPSIVVKSCEKISFNNGSELTPKEIPNIEFEVPYKDPFCPDHVFRGWCTNANGCDGSAYLKMGEVVEGTAPAKDSKLYGIWGYKYNVSNPPDTGQKTPVSVFHVDAYSAITHCEQNISEIIETKKRAQSFRDFLHLYCNFVILATGPLYDPILVGVQEWKRGEEITRKVGNGRYSYVVWDNEKDTYKLFDLYGRIDRNFFWKEPDTDVLIIFDVASVYSEDPDKQIILNCDMLPSKDYMSSWGNPTVREPGDQVDPIIFRTLFPGSAPYAREYIFSSTGKDGFPGEYYNVATYALEEGGFWTSSEPEYNCNMVMTALF